jgi:hypothetical protein
MTDLRNRYIGLTRPDDEDTQVAGAPPVANAVRVAQSSLRASTAPVRVANSPERATNAPVRVGPGPAQYSKESRGYEPGEGAFAAGLRKGGLSAEIGLRALTANVAEAVGAPEYTKSQLSHITQLKAQMPKGNIETVSQIRNLSDAAEFAKFSLGQGIPSITAAASGAVLTRGALNRAGVKMTPGQAEFAGAMAGTFPLEAGGTAASMYDSPEAMERTPGQRLAIASGSGLLSSAAESIVPAAMVGRLARGRMPSDVTGLLPTAGYIGKEGVKAGLAESATEGVQTLIGQAAMKVAAPKTEDLLPSADELLTSMAGGFFPGKAMGVAGSTAEAVRARLSRPDGTPEQKFRSLLDTSADPQTTEFMKTLRAPPEIVAQGQDAVAQWVVQSGQMNNVLQRAADIARSADLPAELRQRAEELVQSGGNPDTLQQFARQVDAYQSGAEFGAAVGNVSSAAMRAAFGQKPQTGERFSAMNVPLSDADAPLVSAVSPYLRVSDEQSLQSAIPLIKEYLTASATDPGASMPVGMLALFGPGNQSREGLRAAASMMQRMGLLDDSSKAGTDSIVDDVLQRQGAWRSLISSNLAPEYGTVSAREIDKLATVLESLAADASARPGDADAFRLAVDQAFGVNAERALARMEGLLPQSARSVLSPESASSVQDTAEQELGALTSPDAEMTVGSRLPEGMQSIDLTEQAGASWSFANNQTRELYDTLNAEHADRIKSNAARLTRSGNAQAVATGVAEYARQTGDTQALEQARQEMPGATDAELNNRFKVLGVYKTGVPEAEQVTYDELLGADSPWRAPFGALRLFEPGKGRATLLTSPAAMIRQIRNKLQVVDDGVSTQEAALRDFSRALAALMNTQKSGQPAFDRVEVKNAAGKYVPLSEMPGNFTLFAGVSVNDVKAAMSERVRKSGVTPVTESSRPRTMTDTFTPREMTLTELRSLYTELTELYDTAVATDDAASAARIERSLQRIRNEVERRLVRDGMDASPESVEAYLTADNTLAPTTLAPEASVSAASRTAATTSALAQTFDTLEEAQDFVDTARGGRIEPRGDKFVVSDYGTITREGAPSAKLESEEFAEGVRPENLGPEDSVTPGDIEAAREGPRLFQEETGELLLPAENRSKVDSELRREVLKAARQLADAIKSAPDSSIKRTMLKELSSATATESSQADMRGRVKAVERQALIEGMIQVDQAVFTHKALKTKQRFTSMEPATMEPLSAEGKAEVEAWLKKVVPDAVVQFVEDIGGMSGSYSRDALGRAIIKINIHATDPLGVAYHEAIHDLFATLAGGEHQGTLDMLQRVATSAPIKRQLTKLLDGNPAAQAQLSDPEEAAAYLFQFWAMDMVKLGPQNETFFQKLVNSLKKFMGIFSDEQMTAQVFSAFTEGTLSDQIIRDEALSRIGTGSYNTFMEAIKPLTGAVAKLTNTVDARFRESGNKHLVEIINKFNNATGTQEKQLGFFAAVAQARNRLINQLSETLRDTDKDTLRAAVDALQLETPPAQIADPAVRRVVADVRSTLDKLYDYMARKGVTKPDGEPIGRLKNYYPRVWDVDQLVSNGDKFVADLMDNHLSDLEGIAATENKRRADAKLDLPEVSAQDVAEALLAKLTRGTGVADDATISRETALEENENSLGFSPAMFAANERILKFLDMAVFEKYLQKDLVLSMTQYINQAVKRAEYSERFGTNGEKLRSMMESAEALEIDKKMVKEYGPEYERTKRKAMQAEARSDSESQASFERRVLSKYLEGYGEVYDRAAAEVRSDMSTYRTGIMALEGTLGHDISAELRQFNSVMMTYQNIRTIPLALLSSFIDPLGIVVRGGEMKQAYKAFTRGVREVVKSWKGEMTGAEDADVALAEILGTLEPSSYLDSLGQTYGSMYMTGTSRRINDVFFRLNGMEGWTRAMRTQATLAGIDFIKKLKTDPDKNTERYLKELGLTSEDIVIKSDGSLDFSSADKRLQFAVMRWVDGAILRPNASQRPAWASNPKFALLFHLNQFTYSFQKVILERVYLEAKNGNYDPMMTAVAGYVPLMLAANIIRAMIQGAGDEPEWMKGQNSLIDWVKRAVQSAGLTGIPGLISDKLPYGVAGPTVQQATEAILKDKDLKTTFEKATPLQSIHRHWW